MWCSENEFTVNGQFEADASFGPFVLHDEILEDKDSP